MAVLDAVPGLEVQIYVDGQPLKEYRDEDDQPVVASPNECIQYIESQTDKEFSIKASTHQDYKWNSPALKARMFLDGAHMTGRFIYRNNEHGLISGVSLAGGFLSAFTFSKIDTVQVSEESSLVDLEAEVKRLSKIGEIKVVIERVSKPVVKRRAKYDNPNDPRYNGSETQAKVREAAMKAEIKSHGTKLAASRFISKSAGGRICTSKDLDDPENPLAVFKFKYRSKEILQQLLLIEHTPEPEAVEDGDSSVGLDDLDDEQRKEAEQYIRQLKNKKSSTAGGRVKRERTEDATVSSLGERSKKPKIKAEVIDLSED